MKIRKIFINAVLVAVSAAMFFAPGFSAFASGGINPLVVNQEDQRYECNWGLVTPDEAEQNLDFLLRLGVCGIPSLLVDGDDDDDDDSFVGYGSDGPDRDGSEGNSGGGNPGGGTNNPGDNPGGGGTNNPGGSN